VLGCKTGEELGEGATGAASGAVVVVADGALGELIVGAFGAFDAVGDDGPDATGEGATGDKFGAIL
jgi:hypothetical protein